MQQLICAGNLRIQVFRALDPDWIHNPLCIHEMNEMITSLAGMINVVRHSVESQHWVRLSYYIDPVDQGGKPPRDGVRTYYYVHGQGNDVINTYMPADDPDERAAAKAAAEQDRLRGIAQELAFLSIPNLELTLKTWKDLIGAEQ